jgi:hypothetical protein
MELFSLLATLCLTCVVCPFCVVFSGGLPLYLYTKERQRCGYSWREAHAPLPSTWRHATAMWSRGRTVLAGGWPPLGASYPLTTTSGHHLCMAGRGLDLHCSLVEFCFVWVELIGVFVIPLRDSVSKSAFRWISHAFYVCDLQNMLAQKLVESVSSNP